MLFEHLRQTFRRWLQFYGIAGVLITPPVACVGLFAFLLRASFSGRFKWARWILAAYLAWAWILDAETPKRGGRLLPFMRRARVWNYIRDYFPCRLVKQSAVDPDPKKAYVIGLHPHGIFAVGSFCNIITNADAFPGLDFRLVTVSANFRIPFWRDVLMGMGLVDADRESCGRLLDSGISVCIVVGGAAESLDARPGYNDLTLARRLGFVRIAIEHGADLIPVFSFGENHLYKQVVPNPPGSAVRAVQNSINDTLGFTVPIVRGRGAGLGIVPYRRPLLTVIGKPVPVPHIPEPTLETVLEVHERYVAALRELYYEYRHMAGETSDLSVGNAPRAEELERIRADLERHRERRRAMQLAGGIVPDSEDFRFRYYGLEDEFVKAQGGVQSVAYAERVEGFDDPSLPEEKSSQPSSQLTNQLGPATASTSNATPNPASTSTPLSPMPTGSTLGPMLLSASSNTHRPFTATNSSLAHMQEQNNNINIELGLNGFASASSGSGELCMSSISTSGSHVDEDHLKTTSSTELAYISSHSFGEPMITTATTPPFRPSRDYTQHNSSSDANDGRIRRQPMDNGFL